MHSVSIRLKSTSIASLNTVFSDTDVDFDDMVSRQELLFGPNFTDPVGLTIESCVAFCNQQGFRMAGLKVTECRNAYFL